MRSSPKGIHYVQRIKEIQDSFILALTWISPFKGVLFSVAEIEIRVRKGLKVLLVSDSTLTFKGILGVLIKRGLFIVEIVERISQAIKMRNITCSKGKQSSKGLFSQSHRI